MARLHLELVRIAEIVFHGAFHTLCFGVVDDATDLCVVNAAFLKCSTQALRPSHGSFALWDATAGVQVSRRASLAPFDHGSDPCARRTMKVGDVIVRGIQTAELQGGAIYRILRSCCIMALHWGWLENGSAACIHNNLNSQLPKEHERQLQPCCCMKTVSSHLQAKLPVHALQA